MSDSGIRSKCAPTGTGAFFPTQPASPPRSPLSAEHYRHPRSSLRAVSRLPVSPSGCRACFLSDPPFFPWRCSVMSDLELIDAVTHVTGEDAHEIRRLCDADLRQMMRAVCVSRAAATAVKPPHRPATIEKTCERHRRCGGLGNHHELQHDVVAAAGDLEG